VNIARHQHLAGLWICCWLALLAPAQWLPIDLRITGPLIVFLPPLLLTWASTIRFLSEFFAPRLRRFTALGILLWCGLSTGLAPHTASALATLAAWCFWALGVATVAALARRGQNYQKWFLTAMAAGGGVAALIFAANWILADTPAHASWAQLVRPYSHYRFPGIHLLFAALAALAVYLASSGRARLYFLLLALCSWSALLWTGSRASMLSLGAGSCLLLLLRWRAAGHIAKDCVSGAILLAGALAVSAYFEPATPLGWTHAITRTVATTSLNEASSDRGGLWHNTAAHIPERPFFGHGPDSYRFLTPKAAGNQPHNAVLLFALDLGIPGLVLLLALGCIVVPWAPIIQGHTVTPALAAALALIMGAMAMALFDGVFYHAFGLMPLTVAVGLLLGISLPTVETGPVYSRQYAITCATTIVATGATLVIALHTIVVAIQFGAVPAPSSMEHRLVRYFPSNLFGYSRWIDAWEESDPRTAEEACLWAASASDLAYQYHLRCAGYSAARSDLQQTLQQLDAAVATAPAQLQPGLANQLRQIRAQFAPSRPEQPEAAARPPS